MKDGTELIGGVEQREIVIVEYDPGWPARFAQEREKIATALGSTAIRIDHVGSTAVPGLPAKPIIDIDLSVNDIEDEATYLPALTDAGYCLRVRQPGHRMVRTVTLDAQVHVCQTGSDWETRHLLFRDWLRLNVADRVAYAALKRQLAARDWPDVNAYAEAKSPFIGEIVERAREWARSTDWSLPIEGQISGSPRGK
ncbi:GrpB family protein [Streptomyces sp. NPDC056661]|uniref:GrpB family protein n=1 Tax=Streptomyces sp. NPDC056661 TaxID=3345898 RepID=UPI00367AD770